MPKVNTLTIKRPTPQDLPPDHPFRNPARLAAMQKLYPKYKPMKAKEYKLKPYRHPANLTAFGMVEIFPPYGFRPEQFFEGAKGLAKVNWPSHAYVVGDLLCRGQRAIFRVEGVNDNGSISAGGCFFCELVKEGLMIPPSEWDDERDDDESEGTDQEGAESA